jgi:hypothetical protein
MYFQHIHTCILQLDALNSGADSAGCFRAYYAQVQSILRTCCSYQIFLLLNICKMMNTSFLYFFTKNVGEKARKKTTTLN